MRTTSSSALTALLTLVLGAGCATEPHTTQDYSEAEYLAAITELEESLKTQVQQLQQDLPDQDDERVRLDSSELELAEDELYLVPRGTERIAVDTLRMARGSRILVEDNRPFELTAERAILGGDNAIIRKSPPRPREPWVVRLPPPRIGIGGVIGTRSRYLVKSAANGAPLAGVDGRGGDGQRGRNGTHGVSAGAMRLTFVRATIASQASGNDLIIVNNGTSGGWGEAGGDGGTGRSADCEHRGADGGNGGWGGHGGNGGNGGDVSLTAKFPAGYDVSRITIQSLPGSGGRGASGGSGGRRGASITCGGIIHRSGGSRGNDGKDGRDGRDGKPGVVEVDYSDR